ncbi:CRISPR-associated protein Csx18 [Trichothermofontia sp.]
MYLSKKSARMRNLAVAVVNGVLTWIILIIAPLGLMAVIVNTLLVAIASYVSATLADKVVRYLQPEAQRAELLGRSRSDLVQSQDESDLERGERF